MPENTKSHFTPLDPGRILVEDALEIRYWCGQLHCTEAQLREAIARVGNHVTAVRDDLSSHK